MSGWERAPRDEAQDWRDTVERDWQRWERSNADSEPWAIPSQPPAPATDDEPAGQDDGEGDK